MKPGYKKIDLNSRADRKRAKILFYTHPIWLVGFPFVVFTSTSQSDRLIPYTNNIVLDLVLLLVSSLCLAKAYSLKRLTFTYNAKKRPASIVFQSNGDLAIRRSTSDSGTLVDSNKLDSSQVSDLLDFIESHPRVANAVTKQNLLNLRNRKRAEERSARAKELEIRFSDGSNLQRLLEVLRDNEASIAASFKVFSYPLVLFILPYLCKSACRWYMVSFCGLSPNATYHDAFDGHSGIFDILSIFLGLPLFVIGALSGALSFPFALALTVSSSNIYGQLAIAAVSLAVFAYLLTELLKPNKITFSDKGICLCTRLGGLEFNKKSLNWQEVSNVTLKKESIDPHKWKICFWKKDKSFLEANLSGFTQPDVGLSFLRYLEKHIAEIPRDAEIESAIKGTAATSFTELWLSSLATPPKRDKLTPLEKGHYLKEGLYQIENIYAAGGQGLTYTAAAREDLQTVIIKESVLPLYVDEKIRRKALESFEAEAKLLQTLRHPNIVKLLDYFIEDHRSYLVLERINGRDLRDRVEASLELTGESGFDAETILSYARQMLDVLDYLHALSPPVVHRDFTPDNLVLDQSNQLYLIDFEVARLHKGESNASATMVGKHSYIPPEQIRGNPSPASDLYALGATLYFLYMGKDPEPLSRLSLQAKETDSSFEKLNNLIGMLTQLDENKRPSIAQIKALVYNEKEEIVERAEKVERSEEPLTIKIKEKELESVQEAAEA